MSRHERYGTRDLTFSQWHRTLSDNATCIDLDLLEYCRRCRQPLAMLELARDVGQAFKPTTVLEQLAKKAMVPAFLIIYKLEAGSIGQCRMRRIYPEPTPLKMVNIDAVGRWIESLHAKCPCLAYSCRSESDQK